MAMWHTTMMLTESNKGGGPTTKAWLNEDWRVGNEIGPVKIDKWPCCTQQMHQARQIVVVGQETMALEIGNRKWWCGKSNNVFAG